MEEFKKLNVDEKLIKIFELLSERSKLVVTQEITQEDLYFETIYEGRAYKGKWKPCKYKCGGLVSWPADYKAGDLTLHIHPTDHEVLGFAQVGLDGNRHCPVVRKK
jgi:hypothetical protein